MKMALSSIIDGKWRIRTVLLWMMFACLLPGIVGVGILFSKEYQRRHEQLKRDTIATARAMVQAVDNGLAVSLTAAQSLAAKGAPDRDDLQRFHQLAIAELQATGAGTYFVLSEQSGQQLINTLRRPNEPLPRHGNPASLERLFSTGKPVVSDLYIGGVLKKAVLSIEVPIFKDGKAVYSLGIGLLPSDFNRILHAQKLPDEWVVAIFDSSGTIVARTHASDEYVGQKGTAEFIEHIMNAPEGFMKTVTREGIPTVSAWSRSTTTGWSVGIGIPRTVLATELNETTTWLAGGIFFVLSLSLALAAYAGRKIVTSVRALTTQVKAMSAGHLVEIPQLSILEYAESAKEIRQAAALLRERTTALETANLDLRRLAHHDALTGLQNRLSMNDALHIEYLRSNRTRSPYALLFIDIDFFKRINDSYGHELGDHVLREVAQLLQASLRESDFIARYGGEEFLAILPNTDEEEAMLVAEKIRHSVGQHAFPIQGPVTISVGVTLVAADDQCEDDAVRRADLALYDAKKSGRNRVCWYQVKNLSEQQ